MDENKILKWVDSVINGLPVFLENMKDKNTPGRFKYSLTGDISSDSKWGLGNTVFAVKTFYILNLLETADSAKMVKYIKSFGTSNGEIYDPLVQNKSRNRRFFNALRYGDWNNINGKQNRRAETRQSFAALIALGSKPDIPYLLIPDSKEKVKRYIHSLDWNHPWGAGSHFSHLIFFLKNNSDMFNDLNYDGKELIDFSFKEVNKYRKSDGAWYNKFASDVEKVNGSMKMMTAYMAAGRNNLTKQKKLIDLSLSLINDRDACNNFNLILVLYFCSRNINYRKSQIKEFCIDRLQIYKQYYWSEYGGFSFFERNSNRSYYGAKISKGLEEPDIHGTHLFLWGITLITKMLNIDKSFNLSIPIT